MSRTSDTFVQTGGCRRGWFNTSWPFAKIIVSEDFIEIRAAGPTCHIAREEVSLIEEYQGVVSKGVRIWFSVDSKEMSIIFWTFRCEILASAVEARGHQGGRTPSLG